MTSQNSLTKDYCAIGRRYAQDIVNGEIPAGKLAIKACRRSIEDFKSLNGYRFDEAKGNKVCRFIENLTHVKGKLGGKRIILEPWQIWILTTAFGWVCDGGDRDGLRRFRNVYLELPRGSGKSCLSSALALYMLAADGEMGAEVYSSAVTQKQARIVFDDARAMAKAQASEKLMNTLGVKVNANTITVETKNSRYAPTSSEAGSLDGLNIHCAIFDEMHAQASRLLYDVIVTGAGKRPQSLIWCITTAGSDRSGICYEQRTYVTKILDRTFADETQFGVVYCADAEDDWQSESTWKKANPNWNVSVEPDYIRSLATKALQMPAAQNNFRTKHLCQWVSAESPWMNMDLWAKQADPKLNLNDFEGKECFIALDLASVDDLCAKAYLFPEDGKYTLFVKNYLSSEAVKDARNASYSGWELTGELTVTDGNTTDFNLIEEEIIEDTKLFDVKEVIFDPFQARQMMQRLQQEDIEVIEYRNVVMNMSEPMKRLDTLVRTGKLFHNGSECLAWQISNVTVEVDRKENIFPRKERPENKIDGAVATIMALGRAMLSAEAPSLSAEDFIFFV